jgi:hypothetical protein
MTSGGQLPYQLRPNKAVERLIFLELLRRLSTALPVAERYEYVGFGGPQMEDFRLLYEIFPEMKMRSIERDSEVLKRQRFNRPHTNVQCKLQQSGDFVLAVSNRKSLIVWLDYTEANERPVQIAEFQTLLSNLRGGSVVKVTLNASPSTLGGAVGEKGLQNTRLRAFMADFGRCFPNDLGEEAMAEENFPSTLVAVVDYVSREALRAKRDWEFQILTSAAYADSRQQMLTVTGMVGLKTEIASAVNASQLGSWDFSRLSWSDPPVRIRVPELTLKERIVINQLLPRLEKQAAAVQKRLNFLVDKSKSESEERLANYIDFERHYPFWGKVAI